MLSRIIDLIGTEKPRRIGVSYEDWAELETEIGTTNRGPDGRFQKVKALESNRVTYHPGDDHAYVLGVFVSRNAFLNRGELRAEK